MKSVTEHNTLESAKEGDITMQLLDILPRGSGINWDYEIEKKGKRTYVRNAWDYMEYGIYKDVFPFVVCYENGRFKYIHFSNCSRRQYRKIERADLRDYLESLFLELEDKIADIERRTKK